MSVGLLVVVPFAAFCVAALWATVCPDARPVRWRVEIGHLPQQAALPASRGRVTCAIVHVRNVPPTVVTTLPATPTRALPAAGRPDRSERTASR
jgi:hypothetical protein